MRFTTTFTLLLILAISALGQNAEIRGSLISKDSLKPLPDLDVVLFVGEQTKYGSTTDSMGFFELNRVSPGSYDLIIFSFDKVVYTTNIDISAGESLTLFDLKIGKSAMSNIID